MRAKCGGVSLALPYGGGPQVASWGCGGNSDGRRRPMLLPRRCVELSGCIRCSATITDSAGLFSQEQSPNATVRVKLAPGHRPAVWSHVPAGKG